MHSLGLPLYLALKEVWRNRGRFFLVSLVIALITLLVLFIAALTEGLGNGNREYISKLDADLIVFNERSDLLIAASRFGRSQVNDIRRVEGVQAAGPIAFGNATIASPAQADGELLRVAIVGVEPGQPGEPAALAGRQLSSNNAAEAILDRSVILRLGLNVGDTLTLRTTQGTQDEFYKVRVVGLSDGQQYGLQPTVFLPMQTWDRVRPKSDGEFTRGDIAVNIVAVRLTAGVEAADMAERLAAQVGNVEVADIQATYEALPGYSAQQSTLDTQRIFTLLIGVLVIGGFFQIQMLQKVPQIGVLKAIGASNFAVALAAILQITLVTAIGVAIGGLSSLLLSLALPPTIPFVFTGQAALAAIISLLLIGPLGGIVSVRHAVRIEPLKALGLSS